MDYKSPSMKISEIVPVLREIDFEVTENDFRKPQPKTWRKLYSKIFEDITDISIEVAIQLLCQCGFMTVSHPQLFEEAFSQMAFTLCLQRILYSCGHEHFSVKDVIEPSCKMLLKMGSAFVNMSRHKGGREKYFLDLKAERDYSKEEIDRICNRIKYLKEYKYKQKEKQQDKEAEISHCKEEEERIKARVDELQRLSNSKEIEEIKHGLAEDNALKERLKQNVTDVRQECEKLSNKIVSSPDRFMQDLDRLRSRIQQYISKLDAKDKKIKEDHILRDAVSNKRNGCNKIVKIAQQIQTDIQMESKEGSEELKNLEEKTNELREQIMSLMTQKEDLEEILLVRQSQKQKMSSKSDLSKQCGDQELADGLQHSAVIDKQLANVHSELSAMKTRISEEKAEMQLKEEIFEKEKAEVYSEFPAFYEEMDVLHYLQANGLEVFKNILKHNG